MLLVPCNYVGAFGDHSIPPNCNYNLQAQKEYVGENFHLFYLYNRERLDLQNFGEATVVKESYLLNQSFKGYDT